MSNSNVHNHAPLPVFVAGGAAGTMKGGRHLKYPEGTPMANLLLTILDKAGVQKDHVGDSTGMLTECEKCDRRIAHEETLRHFPVAHAYCTASLHAATAPVADAVENRDVATLAAAAETARGGECCAGRRNHRAPMGGALERSGTVALLLQAGRRCQDGEPLRCDSRFRKPPRSAMPQSSSNCSRPAPIRTRARPADGETVLMTSARSGKLDAVKALLNHGADVNAKEAYRGQTALMWAAAERHPEVVKLLLEHGADWKIHRRPARPSFPS